MALSYSNTGKTITITGIGTESTTGALIIPEKINNLPVTSISNGAFYGLSGLTSITIPSGVTFIGNSAFYNCSGLMSITVDIANSAYTSTSGVLFNKAQTTLLNYPAGKKGDYSIPNSVTIIAITAFVNCTGLTSVTLPSSITSIGFGAFSGCRGLTSVTIPNSVTSIDDLAFENCSGLTCLTIGNSVTSIGGDVFRKCTGLTNVTIPNSVTSIGNRAFYACSGLTSVTIGSGVTNIGEGAFLFTYDQNLNRYGIESVYFMGNAPSLDPGISKLPAFRYCSISPTTTTIYYIQGKTGWGTTFGDQRTATFAYGDVTIPNNASSIVNSQFQDNTGLTSVTIPNSVKSIGTYAFSGCSELTNVTIGSGVTSIGIYAFRGCSRLTTITIPSNVTSIGDSVFRDCTGLKSVYFMGNAPTPGTNVFYNDPSTIYYIQGKTGWTTTFVGRPTGTIDNQSSLTYLTIGTTITITGIRTQPTTGTLVIPSTINNLPVTKIADESFRSCTGLTSVTIPNNVTSIGSYAFTGCTGLTSVTIGSGVTSIGGFAFQNCTGLKSITVDIANSAYSSNDGVLFNQARTSLIAFPGGKTGAYTIPTVTSIGSNAFGGCTGLTKVTIPVSVNYIGEGSFRDCFKLTSVYFMGNAPTPGSNVFYNAPSTIYYIQGKIGWTTTFAERPTVTFIPEY